LQKGEFEEELAAFYVWMRRARYISEADATERVGFLRLLAERGADLGDEASVYRVVRGLSSDIASRAAQAYRLFLLFLRFLAGLGEREVPRDVGLRDWVLAVWEKRQDAKKHYAGPIVRLREGDWLLYPPVPPERERLVERLGEGRVPSCRRVMATVADGCTLLIPLGDGVAVLGAPRPLEGWVWTKKGWRRASGKASG
jgi:hypothetical protein